MFHYKFINDKKVLYSDLILEAEHFFTTRESVIRSDEHSLQSDVLKNKCAILEYLNVGDAYFMAPIQTHSTNVKVAKPHIKSYPKTDALILDSTKIAVYLNFADCTPIILYDPVHNIGAVVHAGWRGTAGSILVNTLNQMKDSYMTDFSSLKAVIGPAIGQCCYCVGEDVYRQLSSTIENMNVYSKQIFDKYYIDLKGINKQQLLNCGVDEGNIDVCSFCTSCNNDMFFSYRKEQTTSRHSAVLKLK